MRDVRTQSSTVVWTVVRQQRFEGSLRTGNWSTVDMGYPYSGYPQTVTRQVVRKGRANLLFGDRVTPLPYSAYRYSLVPGTVSHTRTWIGRHYGYTTTWGDNTILRVKQDYIGRWAHFPDSFARQYQSSTGDPYLPEGVESGAKADAFASMRDVQINAAMNIAEFRSSYSLMADTARRAALAYMAARRGNWRGVRRHLGATHWTRAVDELGNQWLAYRYGWRPLMSDLYNLREKLINSLREEKSVFWATGFKESTASPYLVHPTHKFVREGTARFGCTVKYRFRIDDSSLARLDSLGFTNPLSLAWELIGHSFVVDWFVSVGDFLEGLQAPLGLEFVDGFMTRYVYEDYRFTPLSTVEPHQLSTPCVTSAFGFRRSVLLSYPRPRPYIRMGLNATTTMDFVQLFKPR